MVGVLIQWREATYRIQAVHETYVQWERADYRSRPSSQIGLEYLVKLLNRGEARRVDSVTQIEL